MSKHRKAPGAKPPGDRKQKHNGKKAHKDKTVAAELGGAVMREEIPPGAPAAAEPIPSPVAAAPKPEPKAAEPKAAPPKPAAKPEPRVAAREPVAKPEPKVPEPAAKAEPRLLENAVETMELSLKAAGQGTIAVNRKLIDFARANVSSGFDFAMSLASASSPVQIMQLQMSYWDERMKVLARQAEELRALSADLVTKANEPFREHLRRSVPPGAA